MGAPQGCPFGHWIRSLEEGSRAEVEKYLEEIRKGQIERPNDPTREYTSQKLADKLTEIGQRWRQSQIRRHNSGVCTCQWM